MKLLTVIALLITVNCSYAQTRTSSFSSIDWNVQFMDADNVDTLAVKLTAPYHTDLEKVRAIFSWIAQHISYNVGIYNSRRPSTVKYTPDPFDTISVWKSAEEMTAQRVLHRRIAVCDGYAKLFKTICDYAGLQCKVINGYAKCLFERSDRFTTNHSWNVVMIDSAWRLIDVTWGSGYITYADEYVPHIDETYFLSSPKQFILDHYPEDIQWTLLDNPPTLKEFQRSPFKYKSFIKYGIASFWPTNGVINAAQGDTIHFEIDLRDPDRAKLISSDPFFDTTILTRTPNSAFLKPANDPIHNKVSYSYVVDSTDIQWLHILYNDDLILKYKLNIKNNKEVGQKPDTAEVK